MSINHHSPDFHYPLWWQQQQHPHQHNTTATMDHQSTKPINHHNPPENIESLFEKSLTPSDVGKLNRLVIPKQHAEKYFPLGSDSGVEKGLLLSFEDEIGKPWRFRYSYWNSSQSYVLTKGWSRYVKEKQLDAGDVVVFQRHRADGQKFFIGWRRRGGGNTTTVAGGDQDCCGGNGRTVAINGGSRGLVLPYHHYNQTHDDGSHTNIYNTVPYQPEYPHAVSQTATTGNSKRLRLFGVNMECQMASDHSEPSTPDGSSSSSSHGPVLMNHQQPFGYTQNHPLPYNMNFTFSGDVNQMRNQRG